MTINRIVNCNYRIDIELLLHTETDYTHNVPHRTLFARICTCIFGSNEFRLYVVVKRLLFVYLNSCKIAIFLNIICT